MSNSPLVLQNVPDGWLKVKLRNCCSLIKDGTHGTHERLDAGIPLLSAKNVTKGGKIFWDASDSFISEAEYKAIHRNYELGIDDLLITIVGSLGRRALIRPSSRFTVQRSVAILRCNKNFVSPAYLYHFTGSDYFQRQLVLRANSTAQAGLYLGELEDIEIATPKIVEQKKIAAILDTIDEAIALTDAHIASRKPKPDSSMIF